MYAERLALGIALEASAFPKPGNVHRFRDFSDTIYEDFIVTSVVAVEPLYRGIRRGYRYHSNLRNLSVVYGDLILGIVSKSRAVSGGGNTCLGTALMLAPISIALGYILALEKRIDVQLILQSACRLLEEFSTPLDAVYFYKAIRAAAPSYIRRSDETGPYPNVWDRRYREILIGSQTRLWDILSYSGMFDIVARDVVECYSRAYRLSRYLSERLKAHGIWNRAVVEAYLYQLSSDVDTLVVRKHGYEVVTEIKEKAGELLAECELSWSSCLTKLVQLDNEMASKGINPGSTADIVATAISLYAISRPNRILRP